jgi:hypothetical protein
MQPPQTAEGSEWTQLGVGERAAAAATWVVGLAVIARVATSELRIAVSFAVVGVYGTLRTLRTYAESTAGRKTIRVLAVWITLAVLMIAGGYIAAEFLPSPDPVAPDPSLPPISA